MSTAGLVCTREVVIGTPDESLATIARRMAAYHVGDVVLVEERDGERYPIGLVTDRDLALRIGSPHFDPDATVDTLAGRPLVTAREDELLHDAIKRMRAHGIRRLPIVNRRGVLQGILTLDDVLHLVTEELSDLSILITRELHEERFGAPDAPPHTFLGEHLH